MTKPKSKAKEINQLKLLSSLATLSKPQVENKLAILIKEINSNNLPSNLKSPEISSIDPDPPRAA